MSAPLHADEADTGLGVVRALLGPIPALAGLSLQPLSNTGTDNVLYRLGSSLVVRLPRTATAAQSLVRELVWLPRLQPRLTVAVPEVVFAGQPAVGYPYPWAVLAWREGADAWAARNRAGWFGTGLGADLARTLQELGDVPVEDAPPRAPGQRGGTLAALDQGVRWWLSQAHGLLDVRATTRLWQACQEAAAYQGRPTLLHGDLIPGNLLVDQGRLAAVLDWGGVGAGDPAQDLDPAWSVLDPAGAATFREALALDADTWLRARGFALEQALGGIVYYTPRRHPLADVMRRTLDRLLAEAV